ncbi:MAG: GGDEF domain-containing protein [Pseudomonadota bacterium]
MTFSIGFLAIWMHQRDQKPALSFSLSYAFGCLAFLFDFTRLSLPEVAATYITNIPYVLSASLMALGLFQLYGRPAPKLFIVGVGVMSLAALAWFRHVDESIIWRTIAMNSMAALLFGGAPIMLWRCATRVVDRVLLGVLLVMAAQFVARSFWVASMDGVLTADNYLGSAIATTFQFVVSVAGLCIAGSLFIIFGMSIVSRLEKEAGMDALTGLANRRGLESIKSGYEAALEAGVSSHAVIAIDIDHFKLINDTHGHDVGDEVLRKLAKLVDGLSGDLGHAVRLGGEEFAILVRNADASAGRLLAETIRTGMTELRFDALDGSPVTASYGVAVWEREDFLGDVIKAADKALYEAKRGGRDRVIVAADSGKAIAQAKMALSA